MNSTRKNTLQKNTQIMTNWIASAKIIVFYCIAVTCNS